MEEATISATPKQPAVSVTASSGMRHAISNSQAYRERQMNLLRTADSFQKRYQIPHPSFYHIIHSVPAYTLCCPHRCSTPPIPPHLSLSPLASQPPVIPLQTALSDVSLAAARPCSRPSAMAIAVPLAISARSSSFAPSSSALGVGHSVNRVRRKMT